MSIILYLVNVTSLRISYRAKESDLGKENFKLPLQSFKTFCLFFTHNCMRQLYEKKPPKYSNKKRIRFPGVKGNVMMITVIYVFSN